MTQHVRRRVSLGNRPHSRVNRKPPNRHRQEEPRAANVRGREGAGRAQGPSRAWPHAAGGQGERPGRPRGAHLAPGAVNGRALLTSWSTLSVAMHWLLARVVISRLFGVSIRQLQRGTSWRPSVSAASGPLASPRVTQTPMSITSSKARAQRALSASATHNGHHNERCVEHPAVCSTRRGQTCTRPSAAPAGAGRARSAGASAGATPGGEKGAPQHTPHRQAPGKDLFTHVLGARTEAPRETAPHERLPNLSDSTQKSTPYERTPCFPLF